MARLIDVVSAGALTTVQDWPGRIGLWEVGVPPSGPMDARSFRIANRLVGNDEGAAGLEATLTGPRLRFESEAVVSVTGAPLPVTLDGSPVEQWRPFRVPDGGELRLGTIRGTGVRAYVAIAGGIGSPAELGSRSVFAAGGLGGAPLRRGDVLTVGEAGGRSELGSWPAGFEPSGQLRIVLGPHGAPEFLTAAGLAELFEAEWTVHHHSDRTGVRLVGPRPAWSRADGGEAGLHPSNILDSAYSVGTVMLAGDMAIVVGVDGPSLGGFTAVGEVIRADRWRLGQLRAGDSVRMSVVAPRVAAALHAASELELTGRGRAAAAGPAAPGARVEFDRPLDGAHGTVTFRRAGECAALVEFGEPSIDLRSRVRAGQLQRALADAAVAGVIDLTPGVRSLHVQHDPDLISAGSLLDVLKRLESELPPPDRAPVDGRVVRMPLAWREREAMRAIVRYQESVRADAPWCPDNVDFIRRVNGLPDEDSLLEIVYGASYLVLGLGDVYLGAPVAVPLDPRHRLVTTKYTPARTWTPANAVGIGGAFMCVYGVEGPGGYQLVGRTAQIWCSAEQPPWRLRHFDQLQFVPVSEAELYEIRADPGWRPDVRESPFDLAAHERFLLAHASSIAAWTARREAAFARERSAWAAAAEVAA